MALKANAMLKSGLHIVSRAPDGRAITISAPQSKTDGLQGIIIMPEEMAPALRRLKKAGVGRKELQNIVYESLEKYKQDAKFYEEVKEVPVYELISKFENASRIAKPIETTVRKYLSKKDLSDLRAWSRFQTKEGYEIVFPFEQPAYYFKSVRGTTWPFFICSSPFLIAFNAPGIARISAVSSRDSSSSSLRSTALGCPLTVITTLSRFLFTFFTSSGRFALASDIAIKLLIYQP